MLSWHAMDSAEFTEALRHPHELPLIDAAYKDAAYIIYNSFEHFNSSLWFAWVFLDSEKDQRFPWFSIEKYMD